MRKTILILTLFVSNPLGIWASDLRIVYGVRDQLPMIIDRDEILYIADTPTTPTDKPAKVYDKEHPPASLEEVAPSVDIHLKNGTVLHMIVASMNDLVRQLK